MALSINMTFCELKSMTNTQHSSNTYNKDEPGKYSVGKDRVDGSKLHIIFNIPVKIQVCRRQSSSTTNSIKARSIFQLWEDLLF